ncbi:MAG: LysE/ArgO family amino acid transporter [Desulfobacterales bacterium]|nr:LysE/ArgO family amino acid transporter [Desulfobacterales bacterium]
MLLTYFKGLATGGSLIVAIGAQNAFVLSQGVRKNHYLVIPLICALCDAALVSLGVSGTGTLIASSRSLSLAAGIGGSAFLFVYGLGAFRSALRGGKLSTEEGGRTSLKKAVLATLAVTLLNPHVYMDTVVLLGSLAAQFPVGDRPAFGAGAVTASFVWFFSLSLGAKLLAPLFRREMAWRVLDTLVGLVMWAIGTSVLVGVIRQF